MAGWFLIGFGVLLFLFRSSPAYHNWMKQRLNRKGLKQVDERVQSRMKMINMLAIVYLLAGIALVMSRL